MEDEEDKSPFWLQTNDRRRNLRRQASSIFLNSGLILIILLVIAFVFVFIIVPSFVSFTSQIFKPNSIKKSWDSLNLVLVLFALVCGFLSKNNNNSNNESTSYQSISNVQQHGDVQTSYPPTPARRWYDHDHDHQYQNRTAYNTLTRLRSFSSYPDLRQESFWVNNDEQWRFYDDTHIKNSYPFSSSSDQLPHHRPLPQQENQETKKQLEEVEDVGSKDKEVVYTPPPPPSPPPLPSPPLAPPLAPQLPPSKAVRRKVKRTYQELGLEKRREEEKVLDDEKFYVPPPSPPSAPPLPTQLPPTKAVRRKVKRNYQDLEHEKRKEEEKNLEEKKFYIPPPSPPPPPPPPPPIFSKNEKKRGKDLLTTLRRKKKKQREKSVENLESLFNPEPSTLSFMPPPPPPPPPPPHFFQNLFYSNKKSKSKKTNSAPPPPPPPPPPVKNSSSRSHVEWRASRTTAQEAEVTTHQPPKAVKTTANNFSRVEENVESGNASPVIAIPPPPPLPPFKMRSWKFVRDGDYVRVASFNSCRSGSSDLDSEEPSDKESISPMARKEGGDSSSSMPLFCPSPDVNTKAENFIARFRAGLKLEKINSVKGRSNLGPGPDTVEQEGPD